MKAGIMEIGDIFVINKCDRQGSDKIESELKMIQQISDTEDVEKPIVKIVAPKNIGIPDCINLLLKNKNYNSKIIF